MISPTVGRVVWYSPAGEGRKYGEQPYAAMVVFVHSDRLVNLVAYDHAGSPLTKENVVLLQDDDAPLPAGGHCQWMPYQKAVAKGDVPPTLHATKHDSKNKK